MIQKLSVLCILADDGLDESSVCAIFARTAVDGRMYEGRVLEGWDGE